MPLDFTASNLTHTKPQGTLDFISPEASIIPVGLPEGADFKFAGSFTGQYLEGAWFGKPYYKPPGHVVVTTWGTETLIGAGVDSGEQFGTPTAVIEQFIYPSGYTNGGFGATQLVLSEDYVHPTVTVNTSWQGSDAYTPASFGLVGSWSDAIILQPFSVDYTEAFGTPDVFTDQIISVTGWQSETFGDNYVLHWYEYAAPEWTIDASWVSENEYTPPVGTLHVLWQPDVGEQTIAPISFIDGDMGTARVARVIGPSGFTSEQFGTPQLFPSICTTWTFTGPTSQVPLNFSQADESIPSNQVPLPFRCQSSGIRYTDFEGFIEALDGAEASVKMYDLYLTFNSYDGATLEPVDLWTAHGLPLSFYEGADWTGGRGCQLATGFIQIGTSENTGTIGTNGFRMQNSGGAASGSVIGLPAIPLSATESIEFTWNQTLSGNWYDNDETDAAVHFGLFFDRNPSNITTLNGTWEYDSPYYGYTEPNNWPWLQIWLPRDSAAKNITPRARTAAGVDIPLTAFTKPAGVDLYAPGSSITVKLVKNGTKIRLEFYHNTTLLTGQNTNQNWPTEKVVPVWYYRNYTWSGSYVDIANVQVCTDGLLTTYPSTNFNFSPEFFEGAVGEFNLATTTSIVLNDFVEGATATAVLDTRPVVTFPLDAYDGAEAAATLWTAVSMQPLGYEGAYADVVLTINPSAEMLFNAYDGGSAEFTLSTALQFGTVPSYDGATATADLDTLENWYFYEGAEVSLSLATSITMPMDGYEGGLATLNLSTFPSEGMGVFSGYEGASAEASFTTLPQVLLYPNEIKFNIGFNYDILGFGGIDLNNTACCPIKENHARIELTAGPAPDERYDGDKVVFTVELSALPRFSMNVYEGAIFDSIEPQLLSFNFLDGAGGIISSVIYDEYNFNLCTGNFIPDGDHVNVELIAGDSLCEDSTMVYEGATVTLDLQANPNFQIPLPEGPYMDFNITLEAAWILNFYAGEYVRVSNPEFEPTVGEGATVSIQFEEKDIYGFSGEFMEVSLSTDYDVEFLELGCLDNEFMPTNENGDPDLEKFNPVPVELEFFSHSIKARCF